ncbi:chemotaxis protein CheW [Aestuariibacter sp. AA17]|uniref:Chemotaxis protein CheW n=1 Tax=Fluctibacter corallii TaxID=2984329 RepID=A0ABT3A3C0_9ALTE|nr:chemotaxis protein CheW [Aestuariibacter sp. AA17]MCV2883180.1 chemotaxis protein CheW [Aestuariibacter sp. AA17]
MSKGTFAKEEVMEEYLDALLTEMPEEELVAKQKVAKLLEGAVPEVPAIPVETELNEHTVEDVEQSIPTEIIEEVAEPVDKAKVFTSLAEKEKQAVDVPVSQLATEPFQALFFEVAGLTMAVPLINLGGIHNLDKIGPLFGKPNWFKGVMLHREEKLKVVDTAQWVMPEKYNEKLAENLNYQYLIMLDESGWGLASEKLVTTATLNPEDVKWRGDDKKRPWLAGLVKEKMCALINVKQLIELLNKGQGSNDQ